MGGRRSGIRALADGVVLVEGGQWRHEGQQVLDLLRRHARRQCVADVAGHKVQRNGIWLKWTISSGQLMSLACHRYRHSVGLASGPLRHTHPIIGELDRCGFVERVNASITTVNFKQRIAKSGQREGNLSFGMCVDNVQCPIIEPVPASCDFRDAMGRP